MPTRQLPPILFIEQLTILSALFQVLFYLPLPPPLAVSVPTLVVDTLLFSSQGCAKPRFLSSRLALPFRQLLVPFLGRVALLLSAGVIL